MIMGGGGVVEASRKKPDGGRACNGEVAGWKDGGGVEWPARGSKNGRPVIADDWSLTTDHRFRLAATTGPDNVAPNASAHHQ